MPKEPPPSSLGITLSVLRIVQGWPQNELAAALGCGASLLSDYEAGRKTLSRKRLDEIVAVLGLPAEAADRTLSYLRSIRSLSPPEGGSTLGSARAEAEVARVRESAEVFARSIVSLPPTGRAEDERRKAQELWERMKKGTPRQRLLLVKATAEFRSWALCELICERSLEAAADRADRALDLAGLAVYIAEVAPGEQTWRKRLRGYALAHLGNAKRVGGDLPAADETFAQAWKLWESGEQAGVRFLSEAQFLSLEASLRRNQRRLDEALRLLDRALPLASEQERTGLLINRANVLELALDFQGAIDTLRELSASLSWKKEPRISWLVKFTLANNLLQAGSPGEAVLLMPELRKLAARLNNDLDFVRLRWLEGRVTAAMGRRNEALQSLSRVRDDFAARKMAYDAALVSVEIAGLLLEDSRVGEVRALARQILWIFQAQGVHREALSALRLFCEAAEQETVTSAMAKRLAEYLQRARNEPGLQFEDV